MSVALSGGGPASRNLLIDRVKVPSCYTARQQLAVASGLYLHYMIVLIRMVKNRLEVLKLTVRVNGAKDKEA